MVDGIFLETFGMEMLTIGTRMGSSHRALGSWHEFGCRGDANALSKSTIEADKHKIFLLQFRK